MGFWHSNGSLNLVQTTRPYNNQQKKKKKKKQKLAKLWTLLSWLTTVKLKENEKKDKYLERNWKKKWNIKVTFIPIVIALGIVTKMIIKGTGGIGNKRTSGDHPNYNIPEIGQNTEKSPGDLRRLAVTQISLKDHQLTLMLTTE